MKTKSKMGAPKTKFLEDNVNLSDLEMKSPLHRKA